MLTVSIPTYNTPDDLLDRAVRSVLASADVDRLVVVNDGGRAPRVPSDGRVVLHTLPTNRGRYFCDAVVTRTVDGWWSPHDADDWSEPDRWDGYDKQPASVGSHIRHRRGQLTGRQAQPQPVSDTFVDIGHWCAGVYHASRIVAAGGILPQFRVGFDTLFLLMVRLTGPVHYDGRYVYHYDRRTGSLTSDRQTGRRSAFRAAQATQLRHIYQQAWADHTAGADPAVRVLQSIPADVADDLDSHVAELEAAAC